MEIKSNHIDPRLTARYIGILYVLLAVLGPFSMMFVPQTIFVSGDVSATAKNIVDKTFLFRLGIVGSCLIVLVEVVLCTQVYSLFKYVNKILILTAVSARLLMIAVQAVILIFQGLALEVLGSDSYSDAFTVKESEMLAYLSIKANFFGVHIWEVFFSMHCALLAFVIYVSGFLPRALGVLMFIASVGYGVNGFGNILLPSYVGVYIVIVSVGALLGEIPLMLWLLIKNIDVGEWEKIKADND